MERQEYLDRVRAVARDLIDAARAIQAPPVRLTVVGATSQSASDPPSSLPRSERRITREFMLRRTRWLRDAYGLQWQIDQATLGAPLGDLDDAELRGLLTEMERARECLAESIDGVGFDSAGLVRNMGER